jgi:hypothetical protein
MDSFFAKTKGIIVSLVDLRVMTEYDWMQAMSAFSTVYDDTGLFGIHLAMVR